MALLMVMFMFLKALERQCWTSMATPSDITLAMIAAFPLSMDTMGPSTWWLPAALTAPLPACCQVSNVNLFTFWFQENYFLLLQKNRRVSWGFNWIQRQVLPFHWILALGSFHLSLCHQRKGCQWCWYLQLPCQEWRIQGSYIVVLILIQKHLFI